MTVEQDGASPRPAPFRHEVTVEWGHCDPAGIVFYPRYFEMFDAATAHMLQAASGLTKFQLIRAHGIVGWPMVKTGADFRVPSRFGDRITIESAVGRLGRSSFEVEHLVLRGTELSIVAYETRVWAVRHPDDPERIRSAPLPPDLADALRRGPVRSHVPKEPELHA